MKSSSRITFGYVAALLAAFSIGMLAGWQDVSDRIDGEAYDWMFRLHPQTEMAASSVILAFDEETFDYMRGMRNLRGTLATALDRLSAAKPSVVAIDIILAEEGDPVQDRALESALARTRNVVLASDLMPERGVWQEPLAQFRAHGAAVGHVHAHPDPVSRVLPLEHAGHRQRRWAMALEAYRLARGVGHILEEPGSLEVGDLSIPAVRESARALYIRYRQRLPIVSVARMLQDDAVLREFRNKAVFVGVTSQSAAHDRLMTPFNRMMTGVEIHAQSYETLVGGRFFRPASHIAVILICAGVVIASGLVFALLSGWAAYAGAAAVLITAHLAPHVAFRSDVILPHLAPIWSAWLAVTSAAAWQYFIVRRQLQKSESDKGRYQQAIHFVTHEMRSPLTAIQGSSELMGRYNLNEDKRKQIAQMINSESKRLARMIQTFLDIERLTDGQAEIRADRFAASDLLQTCIERARPLADRKRIAIVSSQAEELEIQGDRELLEYAVYNLLTNAVKYSEQETQVTTSIRRDGQQVRVSVTDQGIGMDEKEIRNIFRKFYRTRKAETSGEAGTGIGLSIVDQIVSHHAGRMEVTSAPGQGSCFTMVLPVAPVSRLVSQKTSQ